MRVLTLIALAVGLLSLSARAQFVGITGTGAGIHYENYGVITAALAEARPFEAGNTTITVYQDFWAAGFGGGVDLDQGRLYYKTNSGTVGTINDGSWTVVTGSISAVGASSNDRATFDITGVTPGTDIMFYIRFTEGGTDYYGFSGTTSPHTTQPSTQGQLYKIRFNSTTTYNTARIDGVTWEWGSSTQLAGRTSGTPGRTLDVTWDADYIYLLVNGGFTASSGDRVLFGFDLDPGSTNGSTGAYNGAQFPDRYRPEIIFRARGTGSSAWTVEKSSAGGGGWPSTVSAASDMSAVSGSNTTNLEVRILRSAIGSFSSLGIFVWLGNSADNLYDAFGYGNPTSNAVLPIQFGYASLGTGVNASTDDYIDGQYTTSTAFDMFGSTVYRNLRISGTGSVGVDVAGVATITSNLIVSGTLTIDAGATFQMRDFTNSSDAPATVDLDINGTLDQQGTLNLSTTTASDLFVAGNWTGSGTLNDNNRQTTFDGASSQTLAGGKTFSFLQVNKSAGELQAQGALTVTNTLTLTSGNLNLQGNTFTLGNSSSTGALALGANRVYNGPFTRFVNASTAALSLPAFVGASERTVTIQFATGNAAGTTVTLNHFDYSSSVIHPGLENSNFSSGSLFTAGIDNPNKIAPFLWELTSGATENYSITLRANDMPTVADPTLLRVLKRANASSAYAVSGTFSGGTGTGGDYDVSSTGNSGFSEITLGNGGPELLPVTWLQVGARRTAQGAEVIWATASELNNERFEVERSATPGFESFAVVATQLGRGTTTERSSYRAVDADVPTGAVYYRIRQVDVDGKWSRSAVARLDGAAGWAVYPTVVGAEAMQVVALGEAPERVEMHLVSLSGQSLWSGPVVTAGLGAQLTQLLQTAAPGLYALRVGTGPSAYSVKLLRP